MATDYVWLTRNSKSHSEYRRNYVLIKGNHGGVARQFFANSWKDQINLTLAPFYPPLICFPGRALRLAWSSRREGDPFIFGPLASSSSFLYLLTLSGMKFYYSLFSCSFSNYMSNLFSHSTRLGDFCESLWPNIPWRIKKEASRRRAGGREPGDRGPGGCDLLKRVRTLLNPKRTTSFDSISKARDSVWCEQLPLRS